MSAHFDLSLEEMKSYGYKIVDLIAEHWDTMNDKKPVTSATRKEMDNLFLQEAPDKGMNANEVLDFVMGNVIQIVRLFHILKHILLFQGQVILLVQWPIVWLQGLIFFLEVGLYLQLRQN